jgi:hypothetical protein
MYRNSYINLALPLVSASEPMPVLKNKVIEIITAIKQKVKLFI